MNNAIWQLVLLCAIVRFMLAPLIKLGFPNNLIMWLFMGTVMAVLVLTNTILHAKLLLRVIKRRL